MEQLDPDSFNKIPGFGSTTLPLTFRREREEKIKRGRDREEEIGGRERERKR